MRSLGACCPRSRRAERPESGSANTGRLDTGLQPTADGFRPMVMPVADSRTMVVRAVPELMTWIATWIAEHDTE